MNDNAEVFFKIGHICNKSIIFSKIAMMTWKDRQAITGKHIKKEMAIAAENPLLVFSSMFAAGNKFLYVYLFQLYENLIFVRSNTIEHGVSIWMRIFSDVPN